MFAAGAVWVLMVFRHRAHQDRVAVACMGAWKFVGMPMMLLSAVEAILRILGNQKSLYFWTLTMPWLMPLLACVAAVLASQDLGRIAHIPICGVQLAQQLATPKICQRVRRRVATIDAATEF